MYMHNAPCSAVSAVAEHLVQISDMSQFCSLTYLSNPCTCSSNCYKL